MLDELILGGEIQETSKKNVLKSIQAQDLLQEVSVDWKTEISVTDISRSVFFSGSTNCDNVILNHFLFLSAFLLFMCYCTLSFHEPSCFTLLCVSY